MDHQIFSNVYGKGVGLEMRTRNGLLWALGKRQDVFQQGPNEQAIISSPLYSDLRFQCTDIMGILNGQE